MYEDLNVKQKAILTYIKKQTQEKGYPPSVREICVAVSLKSTSTVHAYLKKLEVQGYIRRDPAKTRAIEVICHDPEDAYSDLFRKKEMISLPVLGCVTAGEPILAVENMTDVFPLPLDFVENEASFILNVRGVSMIDAGIFDGDYIIVSKQATVSNGEIVVALILNTEATVKRIFYEDNQIRLQPENKSLKSAFYDEKDIQILGKVTGLFRKY